ncbi:MAG: hypothetical protein OHK93_004749 [Ramalina farinacea]|uniref:Uncharacterized protein n=1 Tax=Ramalina farinacea TaxID=258253 RepID=A0AA43QZ62_9LECA|nr:hypothetical protein [Ramalina farinacea]
MYISSPSSAFTSLLALTATTALLPRTLANPLHPREAPSKTPQLTYLFTVTVNVGTVLLPPIVIPGGTRLIEPLTSGSISGPYLNATVKGGLAYPTIVDNGAVQVPEIVIYGTTIPNNGTMASDKGENYFAIVEGVGGTMEQESALRLEIGGGYAGLNRTFIVADIKRNADGSVVSVDGFGAV